MANATRVVALLTLAPTLTSCSCLEYRELRHTVQERTEACRAIFPDRPQVCDEANAADNDQLRTKRFLCIQQGLLITFAIVATAVAIAGGGNKRNCTTNCEDTSNYWYPTY